MTASDHLRDTRDPASGSRVIRDNESWQRTDLGRGGRATGRQYYDDRGVQSVTDDRVGRVVTPGSAGRTLTRFGIGIAVAGAAGWLWMTLAFLSAVGAGDIPDDAFGTRVGGISLLSGGFTAIVIGVVLALIGSWLAKAARRRSERARWDRLR
jgi:hypothetical protein